MDADYDLEIENWRRFGDLLGLDIQPFDASKLGTQFKQRPLALVSHDSAKCGMVIIPRDFYSKELADFVTHLGYGYSVVGSPSAHFNDEFQSLLMMFDDWGFDISQFKLRRSTELR